MATTVILLDAPTRQFTGFTHKCIVNYTDLIAAATSATQVLYPTSGSFGDAVGNGIGCYGAAIHLVTPFVGNSLSACTLKIGDPADDDRYIVAAAVDVFTALATNTKNNVHSTAVTSPYIYAGGDGTTNTILKGIFTATGGNFGDATSTLLTAGQVEIYFKLHDIRDLSRPIK